MKYNRKRAGAARRSKDVKELEERLRKEILLVCLLVCMSV